MGNVNPRCPSLADCIRSHGLWSLWDMLKFNGSSFYNLITIMSTANAGMKKHPPEHLSMPLPKGDKKTAPIILKQLQDEARNLGAKVTEMGLAELLRDLGNRKQPMPMKKITEQLDVIQTTLRRELSLIHLFVLEGSSHKYFSPDAPLFGPNFETKFPSAVYEIDEAGKCLALGRPTAAVFHLMRIMEIGVRATARCLDIPDPIKPTERNWGAILRNIKDKMEEKSKSGTWQSGDKQVFETVYVSLDAVRAAWRNTTMHVESKYAPDEAEHILLAVRAFMVTLSARMDENGDPKA